MLGFTPTGVGKRNSIAMSSMFSRVHPHGRGEKRTMRSTLRSRAGSPPRAWGKAWSCLVRSLRVGFTPTGVGKSPADRFARRRSAIHPHGRGEKPGEGISRTTGGGSPPRAWGKGRVRTHAPARVGFTPTGVGKRLSRCAQGARSGVHPHGRGEKSLRMRTEISLNGSPPRAWGKDAQMAGPCAWVGFTPTGVGKS